MEKLTKEQILKNAIYKMNGHSYNSALEAMQEYASQITADRDKRISDLEETLKRSEFIRWEISNNLRESDSENQRLRGILESHEMEF